MYANFYGTGDANPVNLPHNLPQMVASGFNSITLGLFHIGRDIHNAKTNQNLGDIVYADTVAVTSSDDGTPTFMNGYGEG